MKELDEARNCSTIQEFEDALKEKGLHPEQLLEQIRSNHYDVVVRCPDCEKPMYFLPDTISDLYKLFERGSFDPVGPPGSD